VGGFLWKKLQIQTFIVLYLPAASAGRQGMQAQASLRNFLLVGTLREQGQSDKRIYLEKDATVHTPILVQKITGR
jgi:hypothetical protein